MLASLVRFVDNFLQIYKPEETLIMVAMEFTQGASAVLDIFGKTPYVIESNARNRNPKNLFGPNSLLTLII
jgi:hypothetical protein